MANAVEDTLKRLEVEINATNERLNRLTDSISSPAADVPVAQPTPAPVTEAPVTPAA